MNMHKLVRGPVGLVNPDKIGTLYTVSGYAVAHGIRTPSYQLADVRLQFQAAASDGVSRMLAIAQNNSVEIVYAYGNISDLSRPDDSGGSVIEVDNRWYYVQRVLEWWPGWCCLSVVRQLDAATIAEYVANTSTAEV